MRVNRTVKRQNLFYLIFFSGRVVKENRIFVAFFIFFIFNMETAFSSCCIWHFTEKKRKNKQNKIAGGLHNWAIAHVSSRECARASDLRKKILSSQMNCLGLFKVLIKQKKQGWRVYVSSQMAFHLGVKIWPKMMGTHTWLKNRKKVQYHWIHFKG